MDLVMCIEEKVGQLLQLIVLSMNVNINASKAQFR